ncbi:MAG: DNA repair exonuclease [Desulfobacterales bacterium]|jgi:DNA repair exonuclease SbcCD nuclease subunit
MDINEDHSIRILFVADTHLGFDLPFRPRIKRRRRGTDFFANFERALAPALNREVDCVLHGGDLFYRSKVPPRLVEMVFEPLKRVADAGVPVYVVPGNHERSAIPHHIYTIHPQINILNQPRTFVLRIRGLTLALAGFPFVRSNIRNDFRNILMQTGWHNTEADGYLLCVHQSIEGARVGPANYTFRYQTDVITARDIPRQFSAVLAGHIHRHQILRRDLQGNLLPAPVFYAGSIERTSFAEKDESKGFLTLSFKISESGACELKNWVFHELPARPMRILEVHMDRMNDSELEAWLTHALAKLPADSIVKLKVYGKISPQVTAMISAPSLRALAPASMNISAVPVEALRPFKKSPTAGKQAYQENRN